MPVPMDPMGYTGENILKIMGIFQIPVEIAHLSKKPLSSSS